MSHEKQGDAFTSKTRVGCHRVFLKMTPIREAEELADLPFGHVGGHGLGSDDLLLGGLCLHRPKHGQTHANTNPFCPNRAYLSPEPAGNGVTKSKRSHSPHPPADRWEGSQASNSSLGPHQEEPRLDMFIQQISEGLGYARHCSVCWRLIQQETKSLFSWKLHCSTEKLINA